MDGEQAKFPHQPRTEVLTNKTLVLVIAHGVLQRGQPGLPDQLRKPGAVFISGRFADAFDVGVHGKAQRIGVDALVSAAADGRLVDHIGVRTQPIQHETIGQMTIVVHGVEQLMVPEGGPAFIHDLGLALRVKILCDLAHQPDDLTLPRLQQRCIFLDEIQQVFLRLAREALGFRGVVPPLFFSGQSTP